MLGPTSLLNRMQGFHYKIIPNTIVITDLGRDSKSCKGGGGGGGGGWGWGWGVKISQPPLQYFTPLVTNIGESLFHATPVVCTGRLFLAFGVIFRNIAIQFFEQYKTGY